MWEGPNLFRALEDEWRRAGSTSAARAALTRWADADSALRGVEHPAAVVERCQRRHDEHAPALLRAVIAHAGEDPLAARTVLQAVLPGLAAVSRRARPFVGPGRVWVRVDELDQHVVAVGYERIHALAAAPPAWVARAVVDGTWQRVRWYALFASKERGWHVGLSTAREPVAAEPSTPGEELAGILTDAVERGVLEELDAWVVFHSRVTGTAIPALAADVGVGCRRLWRRRERAEQRLVATGSNRPGVDLPAVAQAV